MTDFITMPTKEIRARVEAYGVKFKGRTEGIKFLRDGEKHPDNTEQEACKMAVETAQTDEAASINEPDSEDTLDRSRPFTVVVKKILAGPRAKYIQDDAVYDKDGKRL